VNEFFAHTHAATLKSSQSAVSIQDLRMTVYLKSNYISEALSSSGLLFFQTDLVLLFLLVKAYMLLFVTNI
jgi:hypothetical protein